MLILWCFYIKFYGNFICIFKADIVFVTTEIPHDIFERKNDDLVMIVDVFLKEALTGTVVKIQTLDDRVFRVPITSIIT